VNLSSDAIQSIPTLVAGFVMACLITLGVTPLVRSRARRRGMVDRPEARRVNEREIARGGGIAIAAGFVSVSVVLLVLNFPLGMNFVHQPKGVGVGQIVALLGGAVLAVAIGLLDDFLQLRARWQMLGQLALAGAAVALGVTVVTLNFPLVESGTLSLVGLWPIAAVATVLWIVGMVNSINFIDGLDGLSTGIALIAAVTLGTISLGPTTNEPFVALLCFVLAGALAGFLRWNFHPASIFSGTSGTMFVGYTLAVLSILGAGKIAVALLVLGVPIMDTFWIIVRRTAAGKAPYAPDRGHIHHRLLDLGLSHRNTVLVIYGVCIFLAILSLGFSGTGQMYAFLGLVVAFGLVLFLIERLGGGANAIQESLDPHSYANGHDVGDETADPPEAPAGPARAKADRPVDPVADPAENA
jgi:UDP-GlcNAc:undecaprenyl-phosphate GlcNAc-1-phosphate transferase